MLRWFFLLVALHSSNPLVTNPTEGVHQVPDRRVHMGLRRGSDPARRGP